MKRFLILMAILATPLAARAQVGERGGRPEMPREDLSASGELVGVQGNVLAVKTEDGKQLLVKLPERGQNITVTGSALPAALQRGMLVRFSGNFDSRGQHQGEVDRLTIFTPREEMQLGVTAESSFSNDNLFASDGEKKPKPQFMPYLVAGRLTGMKGTAIGVAAGPANIKANLSEKVQIDFNVADLRYASPGDAVKIDGWYYAADPTHVYANRVNIMAAKPLGAAAENPGEQPQEKPQRGELKPEPKATDN